MRERIGTQSQLLPSSHHLVSAGPGVGLTGTGREVALAEPSCGFGDMLETQPAGPASAMGPQSAGKDTGGFPHCLSSGEVVGA